MHTNQKVEISRRTIIFTTFFLLGLYLVWILKELVFSLFIAFMVMSVIKPAVNRLARYKIPKAFSTLVIFILLFSLIGFGISSFLPSFLADMSALAKNFASLINNLDPSIKQYLNGKSLETYIPNATQQVIPVVRGIFSNAVFVLTTLFFSFYFVLEEGFLRRFLKRFMKSQDADRVADIIEDSEKRIGSWFYGELVLMSIIGVMTYIGLSLIGVKHALSLSVFAGLLEAFPVIGPVIAAVPAFIFAVNQSLFLGVATLLLYIIIQQLENNLLVPVVMKRAVGLDKVLILIVLIIGGKLAGIIGLFIAIPLTLFIESILMSVYQQKR